jgi:microcystin-dependent protein
MDAFIGEIRLMGFGIIPTGWLPCNGQVLPVTQNPALFAVLGKRYGGDGQTNFALPDLRGRAIIGAGQGAGLQPYTQGQAGGSENVTLNLSELPAHGHTVSLSLKAASGADSPDPATSYPAPPDTGDPAYATGAPNTLLNGAAVTGGTTSFGGNASHENRQPVLAMNYCVCVNGIYPTRA